MMKNTPINVRATIFSELYSLKWTTANRQPTQINITMLRSVLLLTLVLFDSCRPLILHSNRHFRRITSTTSLLLAESELLGGEENGDEQIDVFIKPTDENVVGSVYSTFKEITFVSSNLNKIKEVKLLLGEDFPWSLNCKSLELPEPQALPVEISIAKCKRAAELCNGPVIVEDTSLCFNALNGLPGPYIKWFYESIGNAGLAKMLEGYEDKTAYAQCIVSFTTGQGKDIKTFVGSCEGVIVPPSGTSNFGWDQIFMPFGYDKTFAEMTRPEKNKVSHRSKAFREFKAFLNSRAGS